MTSDQDSKTDVAPTAGHGGFTRDVAGSGALSGGSASESTLFLDFVAALLQSRMAYCPSRYGDEETPSKRRLSPMPNPTAEAALISIAREWYVEPMTDFETASLALAEYRRGIPLKNVMLAMEGMTPRVIALFSTRLLISHYAETKVGDPEDILALIDLLRLEDAERLRLRADVLSVAEADFWEAYETLDASVRDASLATGISRSRLSRLRSRLQMTV